MSLPPKRESAAKSSSIEGSVPTERACPVRMTPAFADDAFKSALERSNDQLIPAALILDVHFFRASSCVLNALPDLLARIDSDRQLVKARCCFGPCTGPEPLRWLEHLITVLSRFRPAETAPLIVQVPFSFLSQQWSEKLCDLPVAEVQVDCHDVIDAGELLWQRNVSKLRASGIALSFCARSSIPERTLLRLSCANPCSINVNTNVLAASWLRQQLRVSATEEELGQLWSFSKHELIARDFQYCGLGKYRSLSSTAANLSDKKRGPTDLLCLAPGGLVRLGEWVFRVMPDLLGAGQLIAGGGCLSSELLAREELALSLLQNGTSDVFPLPYQTDSSQPGLDSDIHAIESAAASHFAVSDTQLFAGRE